MEETRSISELKQYLNKFKEDMASIKTKNLEEIPKFSIPNWPEEARRVRAVMWFKLPLCPIEGWESQLLNLKRKIFRKIIFEISETGKIRVHLFRPLDTVFEHTIWSSDSENSLERTMCFIMFSQFLDPVCKKIISKLKRRYSSYKSETDEFNRIYEAVKKSFEPLIPFVVADLLDDGSTK